MKKNFLWSEYLFVMYNPLVIIHRVEQKEKNISLFKISQKLQQLIISNLKSGNL